MTQPERRGGGTRGGTGAGARGRAAPGRQAPERRTGDDSRPGEGHAGEGHAGDGHGGDGHAGDGRASSTRTAARTATRAAPRRATRAAAPRGAAARAATRDARSAENPVTLRGYYRQMALIRAFELKAAEMYTRAKIGGYCHLNLGEEPTVVGLMAALRPGDYLFTSYREHGYALARGTDPGAVMAELFGRSTGMSGGRGGSMHLYDAQRRLLGGYGIVGGQLPPATGAALAIAYRGGPGPGSDVVMCLFGDATTNIGAFHESLNLAAVWRLPIVYVIINNQLGMGTGVEASSGEPDLFKRGCSYRIPGERVDGRDVLAVRDAALAALERARTHFQPMLLEAVSDRLRGHSVVDPARYRSAQEAQRLRAADPVPAYRAALLASGILDAEAAAEIDADVEQVVAAAADFADSSPAPGVDTLFDHVYATPVAGTYRGLPGDPVTDTG